MAVRRMLFVPLMTLVVACTLVARSAHPVVTHAKSIVRGRKCGRVIPPWM